MLTVVITSPFVYPTTVSLGPKESKQVVVTINEVAYLESLPFGETDRQISMAVSRTVVAAPLPSQEPPSQTPTPATSAIRGCTNPTATNYNQLATEDDGSCQFARNGCRDPRANNYDATADVDVPSACRYNLSIEMVEGNNQTASTPNGNVAYPLVARVVQIDANTGTKTPVPNIPIIIQTNGSGATITQPNSTTNLTAITTTSDGTIQVVWKIDMTTTVTPQVRFSISSVNAPVQYSIATPSVTFVANKPATPLTTPTATGPTTTPTPQTPQPTATPPANRVNISIISSSQNTPGYERVQLIIAEDGKTPIFREASVIGGTITASVPVGSRVSLGAIPRFIYFPNNSPFTWRQGGITGQIVSTSLTFTITAPSQDTLYVATFN